MNISRKTKTVKLVLDLFESTNNAISVVDLVSVFKGKMNKTTVYRILNRLEESGILHSFTDRNGLKRYAKGNQKPGSIKDSNLHSHFLCNDCGISSCLPLEIPIPSLPNTRIDSSDHLLTGQCENCHS
tara:strand:+ start:280 stop:663 length:384 start_codon:yes stop_codon:yes gene_type:complete